MPRRKLPRDVRNNARSYRRQQEEERQESISKNEAALKKSQEAEAQLAAARKNARKKGKKGKTISFSWEVGELITFRNWQNGDGKFGVVISIDENSYRDWKGNTHEGRGVTILFNGMCQRVDSKYLRKLERI